MTHVAIIGAGVSGLTLARVLSPKAHVTVFEKARGVGGRMSTRHVAPFHFDHGTQYFTARTAEFKDFLTPYIEEQIVKEWQGKVITLEINRNESKRLWFEPHWVASPNMNSLCKKLAEGLSVKVSTEVVPLKEMEKNSWHLTDKEGISLGDFDWVISTAPPAQTLKLFGSHVASDYAMRSITMQGCYALMIGWNRPWDKEWIAAEVRENAIGWISVNSSKPGRDNKLTSLVIHSTNEWAEEHIDDELTETQEFLLRQFAQLTGIDTTHADYITTHRWRYANVDIPKKTEIYVDMNLKLAATGDWSTSSRIEDVWMHARNLGLFISRELE